MHGPSQNAMPRAGGRDLLPHCWRWWSQGQRPGLRHGTSAVPTLEARAWRGRVGPPGGEDCHRVYLPFAAKCWWLELDSSHPLKEDKKKIINMVSTGEQSRERLRTHAWGCGEVTTRQASQTHLASHPPPPSNTFLLVTKKCHLLQKPTEMEKQKKTKTL